METNERTFGGLTEAQIREAIQKSHDLPHTLLFLRFSIPDLLSYIDELRKGKVEQ